MLRLQDHSLLGCLTAGLGSPHAVMLVTILPVLAAVVAAVAAVRGLDGSSVDAIGVGDRECDDRAPAIPASASPASDRL